MNNLRIMKSLLVGSVALFALLVALNNVIDYGSNFPFVQHVLSMDTTFPDNTPRHRACGRRGDRGGRCNMWTGGKRIAHEAEPLRYELPSAVNGRSPSADPAG